MPNARARSRPILAVLLALALAVGGIVAATEAPATADAVDATELAVTGTLAAAVVTAVGFVALHSYDVLSFWYCSKHRSGPEQTIIHSWPYMLASGLIGYWCLQDFFGVRYQFWVHVAPPGSNNSWRPWPYQPCEIVICEGPAHQAA